MKHVGRVLSVAFGLLSQVGCAATGTKYDCQLGHTTPSGQKVAEGLTEQDYAWLTTPRWAKQKRRLDLSTVRTKSDMAVVQSAAWVVNSLGYYRHWPLRFAAESQPSTDKVLRLTSTPKGFDSLQESGALPDWIVYGRCHSNWVVVNSNALSVDLHLSGEADQVHVSRRRFVKIDGQWKFDGLDVLSVTPGPSSAPR